MKEPLSREDLNGGGISRSVIAALATIAASIAGAFGITIAEADQVELIAYLTAIMTAGGGAASWYYRVIAKRSMTNPFIKDGGRM